MSLQEVAVILKGGTGSGNFAHAGRPGHVGGSSAGTVGPGGMLLLPKDTHPTKLLKAEDVKDGMYLVMFSSSYQKLAPIKNVKVTAKTVSFTYTLDDGKDWQKDYTGRYRRDEKFPVVEL